MESLIKLSLPKGNCDDAFIEIKLRKILIKMRNESEGDSTNLIGKFSFEDTSMIPSYILNKSNLYKILSDVRKVSWDIEGKEVYRLITID